MALFGFLSNFEENKSFYIKFRPFLDNHGGQIGPLGNIYLTFDDKIIYRNHTKVNRGH